MGDSCGQGVEAADLSARAACVTSRPNGRQPSRRCRGADGDDRAAPGCAAASPILVAWAMAPAIAYWLSVPVGARVRPLDDARALLRRTARKTWRYFDTFVADRRLARTDNFQESEHLTRVARRTSPTNIGMGMSTMAAHDLGYLTTAEMLRRLDATTD